MTASSASTSARIACSASPDAASAAGAGEEIHGASHTCTAWTPGSSRPADAPRGPQSRCTSTRGSAATARTAGPEMRTSPTESRRTTSTRRGAGSWMRRCPASRIVGATSSASATSSSRVTGVGTSTPRAPTARAAPMSAAMSPTTATRDGSTPHVRQAASTMPGRGLRQSQPSSDPCGHSSTRSNAPSSSCTRALTASACARVMRPRAMPDWFVTIPTLRPAARTASTASRAPGISVTSAGSPLYGKSTTSVPSRSNRTASRSFPGERMIGPYPTAPPAKPRPDHFSSGRHARPVPGGAAPPRGAARPGALLSTRSRSVTPRRTCRRTV